MESQGKTDAIGELDKAIKSKRDELQTLGNVSREVAAKKKMVAELDKAIARKQDELFAISLSCNSLQSNDGMPEGSVD